MARIEDGGRVPPETPEELALPIVSRAVEIEVIRRGELSAQMQICGLNWRGESYLPLMRRFRTSGWRGKKMAYVGLLHGIAQGTTLADSTREKSNCDAIKVAALRREAAQGPATDK